MLRIGLADDEKDFLDLEEGLLRNDIIYIYKQDQNIRFVLKTGEVQERKSLKRMWREAKTGFNSCSMIKYIKWLMEDL